MIKKNKNFFNVLLYSDFNVVDIKSKQKLKTTISLCSNKFINNICVFILLKSLKQMLKLLKLFRKKKKKLFYKKRINLLTDSRNLQKFYVELTETFNKKSKLNYLPANIKLRHFYKKKIKCYLFINCKKNNVTVLKNLFKKRIYLIINISLLNSSFTGVYTIFNEIYNYKKALFFYILINKILR